MLRPSDLGVAALACLLTAGARAGEQVVGGLQAQYRLAGAGTFSAAAGADAWRRAGVAGPDGRPRECATCHGADLRAPGRHATTGKPIEPLAPSVNPARLTDRAQVEKWLLRNCKWTWGRECTPQEKGDILAFLAGR